MTVGEFGAGFLAALVVALIVAALVAEAWVFLILAGAVLVLLGGAARR